VRRIGYIRLSPNAYLRAVRALLIIPLLLLLEAVPTRAQTAAEWLDTWARDQEAASRGVRSVTMTERSQHMLESAGGARRLGLTTRFTIGPGDARPVREVVDLTVDGNPVERPSPDRRRHYENPLQEQLQEAADQLLHPLHLLARMNPPSDVETTEFNGQTLISIRTRTRDEGPGVVRAIWWLDPADGRLVQARAFVEGQEGAALDVFVRYERIEGLDLPVRKRVEGSFPMRRRMRTFTILVDVRADLEEHRIARG